MSITSHRKACPFTMQNGVHVAYRATDGKPISQTGTALPNAVTVVAYAEFENIIEIDRNVVFDCNS